MWRQSCMIFYLVQNVGQRLKKTSFHGSRLTLNFMILPPNHLCSANLTGETILWYSLEPHSHRTAFRQHKAYFPPSNHSTNTSKTSPGASSTRKCPTPPPIPFATNRVPLVHIARPNTLPKKPPTPPSPPATSPHRRHTHSPHDPHTSRARRPAAQTRRKTQRPHRPRRVI